MTEMKKVWKLLLQKEFYEKHKDNLPASAFDEIGQCLLPTLKLLQETVATNVTEDELYLFHVSQNPNITTAAKNSIQAYLENIKSEPSVSLSVGDAVFVSLWRTEVGRKVAEYGVRLINGQHSGTDDLSAYISSVGKSFIPNDFTEPVDTDPLKLFGKLKEAGKWHLNIPTLDRKIGKVSPGMFIVLLARPEAGKTATIVNLMAGRDGFAAQGAKTHLIANEELADRTAGRCACCYNQLSISRAMEDPNLANTKGWNEVRKLLTFTHRSDISIAQLENYCKANAPDILIIDQLDNLSLTGDFDKTTDRLGAVYRKAREIASKYNCLVIAVSQASAEGENKSKVTFSMAADSKTGKAAAADVIIGVGKVDESTGEEENCVIRHYHVSKNKVSGWHGTAVVKLIQDESRLIP